MPQTYVIKLGGSIVSPNLDIFFDFDYLKRLRECLEDNIQQGDKFFFVLGGGSTMRHYRDLAITAGLTDHNQLHWIGTTVNVLHAEIVRAYFHELADDGVYKYEDYYDENPLIIKKSFKIGGGGRPGHSGDVDAVCAAKKCKAAAIISLKNIDAVYSADPKKDNNAVKVDELSWQEYLNVIGNPDEHTPGANYPIDPIAAKDAQTHHLKFIICDGWNLENFKNILNNKPFDGSTIYDKKI